MTELAPAFATIVMMVFTYNIANGLTAGLVLHPGADGTGARDQHGVGDAGGALPGVLRVRVTALSLSQPFDLAFQCR